jgi:hypothetical protein
MHFNELTSDETDFIREFIQHHGEAVAVDELSMSAPALLRAVAGLGIRYGTLANLRHRVASLRTIPENLRELVSALSKSGDPPLQLKASLVAPHYDHFANEGIRPIVWDMSRGGAERRLNGVGFSSSFDHVHAVCQRLPLTATELDVFKTAARADSLLELGFKSQTDRPWVPSDGRPPSERHMALAQAAVDGQFIVRTGASRSFPEPALQFALTERGLALLAKFA